MSRSLKRYLVPAGAAVALLGFAWFVTQHGPLAPQPVKVALAERGALAPAVFGIATVEARYAYAIGPTQAGRVRRVLVDQGDRVSAGQLLGEIDPVDLDARLDGAALAEQRAGQGVLIAENQLREAQSRHQLASANAERYRGLAVRGFVSREAVEVRRNEAEVTSAAVAGAAAALQAARQDVARSGTERSGLLRQRANLRLVSPSDGLVVAREAEPGSTVVAGQAVLRVVDPASVWLKARIDQAQAQGIVPGQPVEIVLRSRQRDKLAGTIARVEAQSDAVTEEKLVSIRFDRLPEGVTLGELAEVTVLLPRIGDALILPTAALKRVGGQTGVWRRVEGKAHFQRVDAGTQTPDGKVAVLSGLSAGDEVIVFSPVELQEGTKVKAS
ncbi:MAG: efflux RND transporter periplasmic adaptor subunit [Sulfuricella sp.]|nr:efflux RND transporter periplasmic adaptor subunit [Sulfuricella sp.]